eukprot:7291366-Prymnesium_polylepis.1
MELILSYCQRARLVAAIAFWPELFNTLEIFLQLAPPPANVCSGLAVDDLANIAGRIPFAARAVIKSLGWLPWKPRQLVDGQPGREQLLLQSRIGE